ncbi:hypothetical protein ACFWY6_03405 [Streptomyces sp. NPDC059037]|uniref:hypothetical protein n=1 Tax=Streptomyces sp. NPDC059037 TaxID=3346710 RepID=UPI00367D6D36
MSTRPGPGAGIVVDGTGLLCVTLLLRLRKEIGGAEPGTIVHVVATDPAVPPDPGPRPCAAAGAFASWRGRAMAHARHGVNAQAPSVDRGTAAGPL